jgi:ABC-type multidrug transport system ATPase subunit
MGSILQYTKIHLKQMFGAHPVTTFLYVVSPIALYAIFYIIALNNQQKYKNDEIAKHMGITIVFYVLYLPLTFKAAVDIIREKQMYRRQHLFTYGFGLFKFYLAWTLIYIILMLPSLIAITVAMYFMKIFSHTNIFILFIIFALHQLSIVTVSFWFAAYFKKPSLGGIISVIIDLLIVASYVPLTYNVYYRVKKEFNQNHSVTTIGKINADLQLADMNNENINFFTLFSSKYLWLNLNILSLLSMTVIFIILGLFSDIFYLSGHMIRDRSDKKMKDQYLYECGKVHYDNKNYFSEDENVRIKSENLFKKYDSSATDFNRNIAVSNASFEIYDQELVAIVGKNGAGKSTLMKMLYGRLASSYGKVKIDNKTLNYKNWSSISKKMNTAPKEEYVSFQNASVADHIKLYTSMCSPIEDGFQLLKRLNFNRSFNSKIKSLNEVEKNKVKIVLALIKNSEFVFLEEPTTLMNKEDQQYFWNVIHSLTKKRIIIFSTLSVDEANKNADRVFIIENGKIEYNHDHYYD